MPAYDPVPGKGFPNGTANGSAPYLGGVSKSLSGDVVDSVLTWQAPYISAPDLASVMASFLKGIRTGDWSAIAGATDFGVLAFPAAILLSIQVVPNAVQVDKGFVYIVFATSPEGVFTKPAFILP